MTEGPSRIKTNEQKHLMRQTSKAFHDSFHEESTAPKEPEVELKMGKKAQGLKDNSVTLGLSLQVIP